MLSQNSIVGLFGTPCNSILFQIKKYNKGSMMDNYTV
jgi:hypothetical protein